MQIALENKDYDARKELMDGKGMVNQITTEEQFLKFIEMKDAFDAGDIETAQKLQEELGMPQK
ncbi:hypothetical protein KKG31_07350 [Patescibacteria group bacterium]|nr:hypothetical protein [Patescibacteria group bacterium]MBU1758893.1 hypothetical protein [Patescibacteria group bacterium]